MATPHSFIAEAIAGQSAGDKFLRELDDCTGADALAQELLKLAAIDDPTKARLHGFARAIQKHLERLAVAA